MLSARRVIMLHLRWTKILLTNDRRREEQRKKERKRERLTLMVSANLQLAAVVSRALISL